ncbi:MAG: guanylate kinase, partial [Candidatus Eisenbacteria bacterium]
MAEAKPVPTVVTHATGPGPVPSAPAAAVPPAPATGNGFIFVLSGPSGAGKGTLLAYLFQHRPDCVFSVSATTRPRRSTEVEGREYLFLSRDEFERRRDAGEFLEWAEVHGNLYGTPVSEVDARIREGKVVVLDVDVQGGASMRRVRPDAVSVFVYPPSLGALEQRLRSRGTDAPEVIEHRLGNAPGEIAQWLHYDYV